MHPPSSPTRPPTRPTRPPTCRPTRPPSSTRSQRCGVLGGCSQRARPARGGGGGGGAGGGGVGCCLEELLLQPRDLPATRPRPRAAGWG